MLFLDLSNLDLKSSITGTLVLPIMVLFSFDKCAAIVRTLRRQKDPEKQSY
jgi:hypothetical protein